MLRLGIAGAVFCLLAGATGLGAVLAQDILPVAGRHSIKLGEPAPNFQLQDMQGNLVALSDFRGKVVMLNFWATWCGPCRVEMPAMEGLYQTVWRKECQIHGRTTNG